MSDAPSGAGRRVLVVALFLASQLAVLVALVEVGARLLDPLGISYYPETARFLDRMIREEPIGYRMPPGLRGRYFGTEVSVNAHGMRDREVPAEKVPGERRILVLGDSVPFSVGVEADESIPYQLELRANELAPPGVRYRSLNMGVPSYNTEQSRIQLETVGLSLAPDVALLMVMENDLEPKTWVYDKRATWWADLAQRSYAVSLAVVVGQRLRALLSGAPEPGSTEAVAARPPPGIGDAGWQRLETELARIHARLRERGIPLLVVYYTKSPLWAERLGAVGAREGFPVQRIEVWQDPRWKHLDRLEHQNSSVDGHSNAAGCALYGRVIHEALVANGLVETR